MQRSNTGNGKHNASAHTVREYGKTTTRARRIKRKESQGARRTMEQFVKTTGISVDPILHEFVNSEALPGTDVDASSFWEVIGGDYRYVCTAK